MSGDRDRRRALGFSPRALLSLLANGSKAIDVVETAWILGLLDALEPGPVTLRELSVRFGLVPGRLYKLLDCLESLGLVDRHEESDEILDAVYRAVPGLRDAAEAVVGPASLERDRDRYAWRTVHGRLIEVLRGDLAVPAEDFAWPPGDDEQVAAFERSMAAGLVPIVETFRRHAERLWAHQEGRVLDVGGGDGTLAAHLLDRHPGLRIDVYNLPAVRDLVAATRERYGCGDRLGFVAGDFLVEPLPTGYTTLSFVRVLHDWPTGTARDLLRSAYRALPPGGRVLICEEFRDRERLANQFFWTYFLMGVDSCVSRLRPVDDYERMLKQTGFVDVELLPGPFELVAARKP
ncbi:MAG TPA: methyltransferase [Micromonosporaceae bacterium]